METIRIGNYDVSKDDAWIYIQHFGRDKFDLSLWEQMRKKLHDNVFNNLGIDRYAGEGIEFGKAFDKWAEPHILKYDPISSKAKELSNAQSGEEIKRAQLILQVEMQRQEYMLQNGMRNFKVSDTNNCRVCSKELNENSGRINDHLSSINGFDEVNSPICMDCSKSKPDEYHIAFKEKHWNKTK